MLSPSQRLIFQTSIQRFLEEDFLGRGDVTSDALLDESFQQTVHLMARETGLVAGLPFISLVFSCLGDSVDIHFPVEEGSGVEEGTVVATLHGTARTILSAERLILNLLGRLSGIATLTQEYVEAIEGLPCRITCTRKTTPGLRAFEKYAVTVGGGVNHRFGLYDAVLIKDNHIAFSGGVRPALERAMRAYGHLMPLEIEVDTLSQLEEALDVGAKFILLDNMPLHILREAVLINDGRAHLEASGGVTLDTVRLIAETGVDIISVGALTHSATQLDFGFDVF